MNASSGTPAAFPLEACAPRGELQLIFEVSPEMVAAQEAYYSELDELLLEHAGKWVAYAGPRRLGIDESEGALYRKYNPHGAISDKFYTAAIVAS